MTTRDRVRRAGPTRAVRVVRVRGGDASHLRDRVVGEEPLEIRLLAGDRRATAGLTMRTPGADFELAAGFLAGEGVVAARDDIGAIRYCTDVDEAQRYNVVNVHLRRPDLPDLERLERHFVAGSACGVCGKAHLEALEVRCEPLPPGGPRVGTDVLLGLPDALRGAQALFGATGGLHAAGLFDADGRLLLAREDVGRHNALDKALGARLLAGGAGGEARGDGTDGAAIVLVSGRASYELLQKTAVARIPVFVAVSAPSSLAIDVARRFGLTLVGFLRDDGFVVYAGAERIAGLAGADRADEG